MGGGGGGVGGGWGEGGGGFVVSYLLVVNPGNAALTAAAKAVHLYCYCVLCGLVQNSAVNLTRDQHVKRFIL